MSSCRGEASYRLRAVWAAVGSLVIALTSPVGSAAAADPKLWDEDLTTTRRTTQSKDGSKDAAKAIQEKLKEIGCFSATATGNWDGTSRASFSKFKDKLKSDFSIDYSPSDDFSAVMGHLAKFGPAKSCATVKAGPVFGKCDLPKLREEWAKKHDKEQGASFGLEALYRSLPNVEASLGAYFPAETSETKSIVELAPAGSVYDPDGKLYGPIAGLPQMLKVHLNFVAAGKSYSCQRCMLLDAYRSLTGAARNDILSDPKRLNSIAVDLISFAMLDSQKDLIKSWRSALASGSQVTADEFLGQILAGFDAQKAEQARRGDKDAPYSLRDTIYSERCASFISEIRGEKP